MFELVEFSVPLWVIISATFWAGVVFLASVALFAIGWKAAGRTQRQLCDSKRKFNFAEAIAKDARDRRREQKVADGRTTFQS